MRFVYTCDMDTKLTFITGNANKAAQLSKYLGIPVDHHKVDLTEIQSLDLTEIIEHKLKEAYSVVQSPVLVDDVSVTISALGGLPGPFIKYFLSELKTEGICKLISSFSSKNIRAEVGVGYYDGKDSEVFIGSIVGAISDTPKGEGGFGWDSIFIPQGYTHTRAEMNETDYDATSPRKFALEKLEGFLKST